jgi:hypothetical protein
MKTTALTLMISLILASAALGAARPTVGVYYFPGWYRGRTDPNEWSEWRSKIMKVPQPRALCRFYDDSDPRLWDYYTDWLTRYGVDFLAFDWYYNDREDLLSDSMDKGFLQCKDREKVKFALHWCNHGMPWKKPMDQSRDKLLDMVDFCSERYFSQPNYLRIDGKPVFMIYDIDQLLAYGGYDALKSSIRAMKGRAVRAGLGGLYLVAVYSRTSAAYVRVCRDLGFDSFCAYTYVGTRYPPLKWDSQNIPYDGCVRSCVQDIYPFLARVAEREGIAYWPTTFPGWDDRPRNGDKAFVSEGNTPELFGKMFRGAMKYIDPASPIVMIEAWNEWGEGACLEPDMKHGFGYLEEVAKALGRKPGNPRVPLAEEVASWSVLTPDELAQAKAIEGQPWKPKPPVYLDLGKNRSVPHVKLPLTLDLREGGAEVRVSGGKIARRDSRGLVLVSDSIDPMVFVTCPEIPTSQIKRITLHAEVPEEGTDATVSIELFFITALYPQGSAFCAAQLGPLRSAVVSVDTSDIMGWDRFGTPLTSIRIDPGERAGARVLLKQLVVE